MPVYKLKPEPQFPGAVASSPKSKKSYPSVTIPVSPEIIKALKVDGPVVVELKGTVASLESRSSKSGDPYMNRSELRIEVTQVEAYPTEADEEAADTEKGPGDMKDAIDSGLGYSKKK